MTHPIRTVLVDDSEEIRTLLRYALDREPDFQVVAEAGDGAAGVAAAPAHTPAPGARSTSPCRSWTGSRP